MAKAGKPKPRQHTNDIEERRLGHALADYVSRTPRYDPIFASRIKKIQPAWFVQTALIKRAALLDLARKGKPAHEREQL